MVITAAIKLPAHVGMGGATAGFGGQCPPTHERCRGQGGTGKNWNTRLLHCHL